MIRSTLRRGRHKVFIGMAPGVGKTCRMLQEGREQSRDGIDVVIGLLETHGRGETARQANGLEQVPRKRLHHRGVLLEELDVAAVLRRRPQLVLVDELAHSNAPGSERPKRWQDVEALLLSGVNVYSTLNIQHLESLNDRVAELTGVVVRERIPSRVLEQADQVVLVDVTPETLQERLEEGKVYPPEKVDQALRGFFQRSNLIALRELSLREVADRVEEDAIPSALALRERVLVCLSPAVGAQRVLRRGVRLAAALDAPLVVVHPDRFLDHRQSVQLEQCQRLCTDLGGTFLRLQARRVRKAILEVVRHEPISQIVLGPSRRSPLLQRLRPTLAAALQWQLRDQGIDLHLISEPARESQP
jgi:two-component system sensor histidine kinase KdpD